MNNKKKFIIIGIIIFTVILVSIPLYSTYKKSQMNKLIDITNKFFEEYVKKGKESYAKDNMNATYKATEIKIVAGDKNEFVGQVYFEIDIDVNGERDYTSTERTMRIKKMDKDEYKVVDEGNSVTIDGLKSVNYSNKDKDKELLNKTKEELDSLEFKKVAGIYYSIEWDGIKLSYDKKKTWVDVPIPNEYALSNCSKDKNNMYLKENTYYISHKKTAFISTNESDILITISDDKGKSWNKVTLENAYQGGELFIGFSSNDVGYCTTTTDTAMGKQYNYIYVTKDGGKSWNEIGNTNEVYSRVVTGIGFLDDKIGFVGFRYESENNPTVYRTDNAGVTWEKLEIHLPYEYASDYATPRTPKFKNDKGILPVNLRDNNKTIYFISDDKGKIWEYSSNINE
ncbi:hypothetical protein [Clostridium sp. CCUG 7971]|uniref:WD40/YVTN/BNR-like repeat-containing protein n=1 Tax=Clostridium sp. CCUG 7971 TaxID=2811414 RepID=UPI001ABB337D|nr:hypothetical protein [Clostridium sp. CCUG 7971]MBO3444920.1 hypothetical protein [Clostridium sp. CCUG 7971]